MTSSLSDWPRPTTGAAFFQLSSGLGGIRIPVDGNVKPPYRLLHKSASPTGSKKTIEKGRRAGPFSLAATIVSPVHFLMAFWAERPFAT
jgi:hypothetical protein